MANCYYSYQNQALTTWSTLHLDAFLCSLPLYQGRVPRLPRDDPLNSIPSFFSNPPKKPNRRFLLAYFPIPKLSPPENQLIRRWGCIGQCPTLHTQPATRRQESPWKGQPIPRHPRSNPKKPSKSCFSGSFQPIPAQSGPPFASDTLTQKQPFGMHPKIHISNPLHTGDVKPKHLPGGIRDVHSQPQYHADQQTTAYGRAVTPIPRHGEPHRRTSKPPRRVDQSTRNHPFRTPHQNRIR